MTCPDFTAHRSLIVGVDDAARVVDMYREQAGSDTHGGAYWFDRAAAIAAVEFFPRYARLTKGEWSGRPFCLSGWQALDFIVPLFGWKREDTGFRRYRTARKWVPRKNGKTEECAALALKLMVNDGEPGAEGYAIATDKEQAKIVFKQASMMVPYSPELSEHVDPLATALYCSATNSSFKPLSGKPTGKHGFNPSFCIGDELHEWASGDLLTFVTQGMGTRRQPLDIGISTAGVATGFGWEEYQRNLAIHDGLLEDPETLIVIYRADEKDDWHDPDVWQKANPNLGIALKWDYFRTEHRKATQSPRLENHFKNYHLNIWSNQVTRWLSVEAWKQCVEGDPKIAWRTLWERMRGRECYIGVDLSTTTDVTAVVCVFPPAGGDRLWRIVPRLFVPNDTIPQRVKDAKVPYDLWTDAGALEATLGNVVDQERIGEVIREACDAFVVKKIGFDRYAAVKLATELLNEGAPVVFYPQTMMAMSSPAKELERLHLVQGLDHGGHPVLTWMAGNVAVATDGNDNIKPMKNKSTEKIDGIVGTIIGLGLAIGELVEEAGVPNIEAMVTL